MDVRCDVAQRTHNGPVPLIGYPAVASQRCEGEQTPRDAMARAALAEQRLVDLKLMLEEMRSERDAWREQAQRLALPKPEAKVSWWRWLRTTG
jgi:hypothetical protein